MNPYSGLTDLFEAAGLLTKEGNSLLFTTSEGVVIKLSRKGWEHNKDGCLDTVMLEYHNRVGKQTIVQEIES
jgi:hypothetical protein